MNTVDVRNVLVKGHCRNTGNPFSDSFEDLKLKLVAFSLQKLFLFAECKNYLLKAHQQ